MAVAIRVEDLECLDDRVVGVGIFYETGNEFAELGKFNLAATVIIDLFDYLQKFLLGRFEAEAPHNSTKLLGIDGAIAFPVEKREVLFQVCNLFFS